MKISFFPLAVLLVLLFQMSVFAQAQSKISNISAVGTEVVFVDKSLPEIDVLLGSLRPGVKVEYLDTSTGIINSISSSLEKYSSISALHIVTHGSPGSIATTWDVLDEKVLKENFALIRKWSNSMQSGSEIMLYGCEIANGAIGERFIKTFSDLTSAKIAASINTTGSSSLGADWILEKQTAVISNAGCFTNNINRYNYKLAKVYCHFGATYASYSDPVYNYYNTLAGHSAVKALDNTTTIPDLSTYAMVFISLPDRAINATEINNLKALLNRGGRVVLVGENSGLPTQNTNVTNAVIAMGGHLSIQPQALDGNVTYLPNSHLNMSSPLMDGVSKLGTLGAVSVINIGGDATVLNVTYSDPSKIMMAQERLGIGDIVAWADINCWSTFADLTWGTARFFKNLLENSAANITSNTIATLTTTEAYSIGSSSAWSGGNITSDKGSPITQRGICWSTSTASPTTSDSIFIDANGGIGSFVLKATGLSLNTRYFVRSFATNGLGTAYGNTISFVTPSIVNTAPTAVADVFSCPRSGTITGNVMLNDFDDDGDPMTATKVVNASYNSGTFTLNSNGSFTYTNNGNAAVSDFFTYYLSDGKSNSGTVGVSISIYTPTTPPMGENDTITTLSDGTYGFKTSDFTYNSSSGSDFNGITVVTLPTKGVLKYNGLAIAAGATCNDITKLAFDKDGDTGSNPFATFTFKVLDMTGQPSTSSYTMSVFLAIQDQTITFDAPVTKNYGDADFAPEATATSGLTVIYTSSNTSVTTIVNNQIHIVGVGSTTIYADQAGNASYSAAPQVSQSLSVTAKSVTITGVIAASKPYDGDNTATLSGGTVSTGVGTETLVITAGTGTFADQNVGTKVVTATGYALANGTNGGLAANYTLSAQPTVADQTITARLLEITATTGQSKKVGDSDPVFTYTITSGSLVTNDLLTGSLTRDAGEVAGSYPIQIGTLSAGNNYDITFVTADFNISSATSIETTVANKISIYPNPTHGILTIDANEGQVKVINLESKVIIETSINYENTVDISNQSAGVYILILTTKDSVYQYKIVKK